jgi:D-alanyl-D-alanine carboxypeptidase/D-alanyl-D-alanine-endopeptidase (penicillin-binding protein 4)
MAALAASACHPPAHPSAGHAGPGHGPLAQLRQDIDHLIDAAPLARGYWGVLVASLATGETLYARNADKLLMPGSTMKVVTLAAAAQQLGWDYTYETRLLAAGPIADGVLHGDLVVVGSGDPSLMDRDGVADLLFSDWWTELQANGIRAVTGRLIGDDNAFDDDELGAGWAWDDLPSGFSAGVSALQYNENTARVTVAPASAVGVSAVVTTAPADSGLVVQSDVRTAPAGSPAAVRVRRLPGSARLELRGAVALDGPPVSRTVSVANPTLFFVGTARSALVAAGIDIRGPAVDIDDITDAPSRSGATLVAVHRSPPLAALATTMMKTSQNLYAETLLKTLGGATGATAAAGSEAAKRLLQGWGVPPGSVLQADGSGLSRYNYVTPTALVAILRHVNGDARLRGPFEASLPVAGRDGTLAARMKGTPAEGRVRAKTGTLGNVRALAGYATSAGGEPLVFAILANNYGSAAGDAVAAIDAIAVRLAEFRR